MPLIRLAIALIFVGVAMLAARRILRGSRHQRPGTLAVGAALGVLLLALAASRPSTDEWNPRLAPGALLGRWVDGERTLELNADSTFHVTADGRVVAAGSYHLFDWNLTLVDTVGRKHEAWRAVVADHQYRIIRERGDPDSWDGDLGYRRDRRATQDAGRQQPGQSSGRS